MYWWHDHATGGINIQAIREEMMDQVKKAGGHSPIYSFLGNALAPNLERKEHDLAGKIDTFFLGPTLFKKGYLWH